MAQFTKTLREFIDEYKEANNLVSVDFFTQLPDFTYDLNGVTQTITFQTMFESRYNNREIGAETDALFLDFISRTTYDVITKFAFKFSKLKNIFDAIGTNPYVENEDDFQYNQLGETSTNSGNITNSTYANPLNNNSTDVLQGKNVSADTRAITKTGGHKITKKQYIVEKTTEHLDDIMKAKSLYDEMLNEFEPCFMSIY